MAKKKARERAKTNYGPDFKPLGLPTYLASLTIENVRCFGSAQQTLSLLDSNQQLAQWTVILGNNGTGKTTLLQCLTALDPVPALRPGVSIDLRGITFDLPSASRRFRRVGKNEDWQLSIVPALAGSLKKCSSQNGLPAHSFAYKAHQVEVQLASSEDYPNAVAAVVCNGYGASRRMGQQSLSEPSTGDPCATLFDENEELLNAEDWLFQVDYAASKTSPFKKQFQRHRDQVIEVLKRILPDVSDVRINPPMELQGRPTIEFGTPDGWIPLSGIGYGYRSFVAWIVDLASRLMARYPDSQDPLSEPAVVLVDEIDLHLHPTWQRKLMTYLSDRFPNTQFIVTAHSPVFVHAASEANLVLLRRDEKLGHVVIENTPHVIRNWRIDQLLTSDLFGLTSTRDPKLDSLLDERRVLQSKTRQTVQDKARLKKLDQLIGELPAGESVAEIERTKRLDRTLDLLEQKLGVRA